MNEIDSIRTVHWPKTLEALALNNNKIDDISTLFPLVAFRLSLVYLQAEGNTLVSKEERALLKAAIHVPKNNRKIQYIMLSLASPRFSPTQTSSLRKLPGDLFRYLTQFLY